MLCLVLRKVVGPELFSQTFYIATAMGLFAAIPAVIAYNRYASNIDRLATRFESFMEELSNVLQRQASG